MPTITLYKRSGQSSPLSTAQVDANWTAIETVLATLGTGDGTVTSVGLSMPNVFSVGSSPVTTSGTISVSLATQTANRVWAGPTTGAAATPTFRALVVNDLPTVTIAKGGTNSTTALSNNRVMVSSGGAIVESASVTTTELGFLDGIGSLASGFVKTNGSALSSQSTITLTSEVSGILPIANGGSGISTTPTNGKVLIGNGTGYTLANITAGSGITITNGAGSISIATAIPSVNSLTGALTITSGTSGSDFAVNSAGATVTLNLPTATSAVRGALSSTDWSTFNNKVGRTFTTGNTTAFTYDCWYIDNNATLPNITADDVGKILFIKNTDGAGKSLTPNGTDKIDNGSGGSSVTFAAQASAILQAYSTGQWYILATHGTVS